MRTIPCAVFVIAMLRLILSESSVTDAIQILRPMQTERHYGSSVENDHVKADSSTPSASHLHLQSFPGPELTLRCEDVEDLHRRRPPIYSERK